MSVDTEQFRIGELARRAGSTPRAVRYYEELGLLPERGRPRGGHRMYDAHDEERLKELLHIKELLGLTLSELRAWSEAEGARAALRERWSRADSIDADTRRDIVQEALPHIETQIALVASRRAALEELEDELTEKRRRDARDPARARRRGRVSTHRRTAPAPRGRRPRTPAGSLQVGRALEHDDRHADHDDQLVDRPDRAARHLPRHPPRPAAARQHELPAVDDDGLHGRHRGAGGDLRPDRRHVRPRAHVQPRPGRVHALLDPALGDLDARARRPRCG